MSKAENIRRKGSVILVGAGPGDRGLLTLRGKEAISQADTVVHDRLVSPEILAMIPQGAEKIDVGKSGGNHPVPQFKINQILLQKALEGKRVVRLKGGDPFVFGRGGEELELLTQEGIDFEVVPGVTSAVAVPAYAGIPVTHRDYCSSFHVVTGHARAGGQLKIAFDHLAGCGGTLVILMGVASIAYLCKGLMNAGMDGQTPAAAVEKGTTPHQRKVISTLQDLPGLVGREGMESPVVIVVGKVCTLSERFDWFTKRPLFGSCVVVTRNEGVSGALAAKLRALGAAVYSYACMETSEITDDPALDKALGDLSMYRWIAFSSRTGVEIFFKRLREKRMDGRSLAGIRIAAVGERTAKAVEANGLFVDYLPETADGEHMARGLVRLMGPGEKVLICRAAEGASELTETLGRGGVAYLDLPLYHAVSKSDPEPDLAELFKKKQIDLVTFTSSSAVEGFAKAADASGVDLTKIKAVCIGRQTADTAQKAGISCVVSDKATLDSVVEKVVEVRNDGKN